MSRPRTLSMILTAAVACLASTHQARADNLILNGGFETPAITGQWVRYAAGDMALAPWAITDGSVDVINSYWPSYEGNQSLDLNGLESGTIEQSFATRVGQSYSLSFAYANHPLAVGGASGQVSVLGLTTLLSETVQHAGSTFKDMDWQIFQGVFVADSTTTTLRFVDTNPRTSTFGIVLDAVSVTEIASVPEPSSLAMAGFGLVAAGGLVIRRKTPSPRPASA